MRWWSATIVSVRKRIEPFATFAACSKRSLCVARAGWPSAWTSPRAVVWSSMAPSTWRALALPAPFAITARRSSVTAVSAFHHTRANVPYRTVSVSSVSGACGITAVACLSVRTVPGFYARTTSLSIRPSVRCWNRRITSVARATNSASGVVSK